MITSNTFSVSWHATPATLFKLLLVFFIATTIVASC